MNQQTLKELNDKAKTLFNEGRYEEAINLCDKIILDFGKNKEPGIPEQVARALNIKGVALRQQGKPEEAIKSYDEVIQRFGKSKEPNILEQLARALYNKGVALGKQGKPEEAIKSYDEVILRFGKSREPNILESVARALNNKGVVLGRQGESEEAIKLFDEVIPRFGKSREPNILKQVANALYNKGVALGNQGKPEEAIKSYDEVIQRFGKSKEPEILEQMAMALYNKAWALSEKKESLAKIRPVFNKLDKILDIMEEKGRDTSTLRSNAFKLLSRIKAQGKPAPGANKKAKEKALKASKGNLSTRLEIYLSDVQKHFGADKQKEYFERINASKKRTDEFLTVKSRFKENAGFFMVLREWNSYTPVIPAEEESDRGGGYFIRYHNEGIVIDPGYDFIDNFYRAGGVLSDIDHIIVTHAHDDHTAELESLLMLLFQYNKNNKEAPKQINLYLSVGTYKKFSGIIDLRSPVFKTFHILNRPAKNNEQRIAVMQGAVLTVLPAYHDDVLTRDMSVGLGFEFETKDKKTRKIIFTGDSGLYPTSRGRKGEIETNTADPSRAKLNTIKGSALYEQYPEKFKKPDLMVVHIGSIQEQEFKPGLELKTKEEGDWYYINHLGLLGTLAMLHQVQPDAAVISEFGSELKGFHIELVRKISQALQDIHARESEGNQKTFVIPGDLTIIYDIDQGRFLCHDTLAFEDHKELRFLESKGRKPVWEKSTEWFEAKEEDRERVYLIKGKENISSKELSRFAKNYSEKFFNKKLCIHADGV